ncbi:MAG: hypothetical protein HOW59_37075 [Nonomuraea sp.]|nr:hypothetical protein [Nonomuraea sp.]NUQ33273.1 hypothetical protein [Dermatophilaceae bacterium]NUR81091.1 hypothetical protein [Dermatophilaceae bacterium]
MAASTTWKGNDPNAPVMTVCTHMPAMLDELGRLVTIECKKAGVPDFYIKGIKGFGSFRSNAASAGTDNGAHIDLDFSGLTDAQRKIGEACARRIGFYADIRLKRWWSAWFGRWLTATWAPHCHMLPVGDPHLSPAAVAQIREWIVEGENGLAGNDKDDGPRTFVGRTWSAYLSIKNAVVNVGKAVVSAANGKTSISNIAVTLGKPIRMSSLRQGRRGTDVSRYQAALWNRLPGAVRQEFITRYGLKRADLYDGVYGKVTAAMTSRLYQLIRLPAATEPGPKMMRHLGFTDVRS